MIDCNWVQDLMVPMHLNLTDGPFVPQIDLWESYRFTKVPDGPRLILFMSSGSKKEEPRYACLSEARASHLQRMWTEVLSDSPIR